MAEDILKEERAPRAQDPVDLADGGADIGEVMRGGAAGDDVERSVPEGQGARVPRDEPDVRGAPGLQVPTRGPEHRLGEIAGNHLPRDTGERERCVAPAGRDVEHAIAAPGRAPGQQSIEVFAGRVQGTRDIRRRAPAELLLDAAGLRVAHRFFARSAR